MIRFFLCIDDLTAARLSVPAVASKCVEVMMCVGSTPSRQHNDNSSAAMPSTAASNGDRCRAYDATMSQFPLTIAGNGKSRIMSSRATRKQAFLWRNGPCGQTRYRTVRCYILQTWSRSTFRCLSPARVRTSFSCVLRALSFTSSCTCGDLRPSPWLMAVRSKPRMSALMTRVSQ